MFVRPWIADKLRELLFNHGTNIGTFSRDVRDFLDAPRVGLHVALELTAAR